MGQERRKGKGKLFFPAFFLTSVLLCGLFGGLLAFWPQSQPASHWETGVEEDPREEAMLSGRRENLLCLLEEGDTLLLGMVLGIAPKERQVTVFCLPPTLSTQAAGEEMTLEELYAYAGEELFREGVEEAMGVPVSRYLRFDVNSLRTLGDLAGEFLFPAAYTVEAEFITVTKGDRELDGEKGYAYLKGLSQLYHQGALGEEQLLQEQTRLAQTFLEHSFLPENAGRLLQWYEELYPMVRTDLTLRDMVSYAPVWEELSKRRTIGVFYPKGEREEGTGSLLFTKECREKIGEVFALED